MSESSAQLVSLNQPPKHHRGNRPGRKSAYSQAVEAQDIAMAYIRDPKTKPSISAALMRAWDVLEERKRILRGCPLPGQLRPDMDPVQLAKAAKRHRQRFIHDAESVRVIATEPEDRSLSEPMTTEPTTPPTSEPTKNG